MLRFVLSFFAFLFFGIVNAQVTLNADGPGNTYELITSVLAPGYNPIEVPDCNHLDFDRHIDEFYDDDLDDNVFRFYMHVTPDNDRCKNFDRQRNEIKSYDKSPNNLLGVAGEKVVYKWKFKLDEGFQSSPNFSHIHQLKSVGGDLESMPMYTLTTRKGNPDQLELRYAETDKQVTLKKTDLSPIKGVWVEAIETISYGVSGTYSIEIKKVSDGEVLFSFSDESMVNWRPGADFVRPKWGLYRSLNNSQDLRDEDVLFANFYIEELVTLSVGEVDGKKNSFIIFPNPTGSILHLNNLPIEAENVKIYGSEGAMVLEYDKEFDKQLDLDVSSLPSGTYFLHLSGRKFNESKLIFIL